MGNPLHDRRTPQDLAASGQVIEIANKVGDFERLAGIVEADLAALNPDKLPRDWRDAKVAGQLGFSFVAMPGNVPALEGQVTVTIDAVCQRCLKPFGLPLEVELRYLFGGDQAAGNGGDDYEIWDLHDDKLCPADLVEEALIMALPLAAMHENDANCNKDRSDEGRTDNTIRPFASLKTQMDKEN